MAIIGNALSVLALKATIHVTTKPGATVKFSKGGVDVATLTADSSGNCDYNVLIPNFGTWTVSGTSGDASGTATVDVSDIVTYNVDCVLKLWFVQNGNFSTGFSHSVVGNGSGFYDDGDYVLLHSLTTGHSWQNAAGYFTPSVNFDDGYWKNLVIDSQEYANPAACGLVSSVPPNASPSFTVYSTLNTRNTSFSTRHTTNTNVSAQTGDLYVAARASCWTDEDQYGNIRGWYGGRVRIYNLYLTG